MRWLYAFYCILRWLIALALLTGGGLVWAESGELMLWLIHRVGEERALGPQNVIREPSGAVLLTNPAAMVIWTSPFWLLGAVMIAGGLLLMFPWVRATSVATANVEARSPEKNPEKGKGEKGGEKGDIVD